MSAWRVGHGYDLHRLHAGDGVTVGGVFIACDHAVVAHSDGDVAIHALCDALLGAAALGDIGRHFPDSDPRWAGADSRAFLRHVRDLITAEGFTPGNVDVTVVAQVPRLAPHIEAMREAVGEALAIPVERISIKATTHEGVDAVGEARAIAAHAVVLIEGGDAG
ncbi:2-C-methyl-D-erythritol 2,4-cyclodiphosphate synthase [Algiphilus sp.]|uniref:2-C-methyl-D-erythritol 2,4-cyclodiphosphate synthase n=1 Tax=Algiphilus sp. TaxID=1872431 RepID=UPI0025B82247|nr:2-C-methyl-D-erythritol 2,4-cyclodiphosphate synthase [Algiphilus sp.]MCK5770871.1 2-C-methyl-D-erythritol 2,4-cyclodiphosphate synthase [Algiphilus sp.]